MVRVLKYLVFVGFLVGFCLVLPSSQAIADSAGSTGLTVSPVVDEFNVSPGQSVVRTIKLVNPVAQTITLYPIAYNFTTDNDQGRPTFYTDKERSSSYSMSDWMSFNKSSFTLAQSQSENVAVTITAPANAEPGGHYGAALFSTEKPQVDANQSQVSVVGLIGTLMLATVPGNITEKITLSDYSSPVFVTKSPVTFSLTFSNQGNVHVKPVGNIRITNWLGNATQNLNVNEGRGNVLPESERRFESTWSFDWKAVGKYTATAAIVYGDPQQQLSATRTFFVVPIWLLIALGLIILLLIIWLVTRNIRRRHRQDSTPTRPSSPLVQPKPEKKPFVMR